MRILNCRRPTDISRRTQIGTPYPISGGPLPKAISLVGFAPVCYDQGNNPLCTGFAVAKGLLEISRSIKGLSPIRMSAGFVYYNDRTFINNPPEMSGQIITNAIDIILTHGCSPEHLDTQPSLKREISDDALLEGTKYRPFMAYYMDTIDQIRHSLASFNPVVVGIDTFNNDDLVSHVEGDLPTGGQALCLLGYDDNERYFVARNSFGYSWGSSGYCFIPYDYIEKYGFDFWTISV